MPVSFKCPCQKDRTQNPPQSHWTLSTYRLFCRLLPINQHHYISKQLPKSSPQAQTKKPWTTKPAGQSSLHFAALGLGGFGSTSRRLRPSPRPPPPASPRCGPPEPGSKQRLWDPFRGGPSNRAPLVSQGEPTGHPKNRHIHRFRAIAKTRNWADQRLLLPWRGAVQEHSGP